MGWFKSLSKMFDKLEPEWSKKNTDKFMPEGMKASINDFAGTYENTGGDGGVAAAAAPTGTLSEAEAQAAEASRLARLSKYFTSAIGLLGSAKTGSAKVFS